MTLAVLLLSGSLAAALDVPSLVKDREPVVVGHEPGEQVQIVPWGKKEPGFHDETYIKRFEDHTIFAGRPGTYLVAGDGELAWVIIGGDPGPEPGPGPEPEPDPEPDDKDCSDVPEDDYDNVGRVACGALSNVAEEDRDLQSKIRSAYLDTAAKMNNPGDSGLLTLNDGISYLKGEIQKVVQRGTSWDGWASEVQSKINQQEIGRSDWAPVCIAIAEGLK